MLLVLSPLHVKLQQYQTARERVFKIAEVQTPKCSTLRLRYYYSAILTSRLRNNIRLDADIRV